MSNHERESSRSTDGDAELDRAWQQLSDEQPPPALDAAIIAAAHKSTQGRNERAQVIRASPPYRSWLTRWQPLAAAAAVAGLAFVLVQSLPRDHDVAPSLRMEEPATTPAAAQRAAEQSSHAEASEAKSASPPRQPSLRSQSRHRPARSTRSRGRHGGDDACDRSRATTACGAGDDGPNCVGRSGRGSCTGTGTDNSSARRQRHQQETMWRQRTPRSRAARVAALYAAGDIDGAADALREFRVVDPDADSYLPESLRDWARTVE